MSGERRETHAIEELLAEVKGIREALEKLHRLLASASTAPESRMARALGRIADALETAVSPSNDGARG